MKINTLIVLLMVILGGNSLKGQNEMLEVQVSRDSVYIGNQVKVSFIASNVSGQFTAPEFKDFELVSGPNTSSSYSFVNGEVNRKTTYTYLLQPLKEGALKLGKAGFETSQVMLYTNEITIFVKPNPKGIREEADKNNLKNRFDDMLGDLGNMNDFFFGTPDWKGFEVQPKEITPAPPKKTYPFKTEKL